MCGDMVQGCCRENRRAGRALGGDFRKPGLTFVKVAGYRLEVAGGRLQVTGWRLPVGGCGTVSDAFPKT